MCVLDIWGQLVFHPASAQRAPGHMDIQPLIALVKGMGNTSPQLTAEATEKSQPPSLAPTRQFLKTTIRLKDCNTFGPRF